MNDKGLAYNDWRAAAEVLRTSDDVERFSELVHTHRVRVRDHDNWTLLHWTCRYGRVKCTEWLLQSGSDIEAQSNRGIAPLHTAASNGHVDCVALLLCYGAQVHPVDKYLFTPLSFAVKYGHQQTGRLLLDAGVRVVPACEMITSHSWVFDFLRGRQACAKAVIAFIISRKRGERDTARMTGKMIWNTRGAEEWENASSRAKRTK